MIIKQLPILLFVSIILFAFSCGTDSPDIEYPAKYISDGFEIESLNAFEYDGSTFNEIPLSLAEDPDYSGQGSSLKELVLTSESQVTVTDGFETGMVSYELKNNQIDFRANGSQYVMDLTNDGNQLEVLIGRGGPYDGFNTSYASASCSDINCNDYDELLYGSTIGEIQYFIVFKEKYKRQ